MVLPTFLIIGAQKSGTTWLAQNLSQHPDIFVADKEIYYFNNASYYERGIKWYENHFIHVTSEHAIGEKTPGYIYFQHAYQRIIKDLPDVRLIAVLRDPIKRVVSAINHHKRAGRINPHENIDNLINGILSGNVKYLKYEKDYQLISRSKYYSQIKPYYDHFGQNKLMTLIFEDDILKEPERTLANVCNFLGVDSNFRFEQLNKKANQNTATVFQLTLDYYLPWIRPIARQKLGKLGNLINSQPLNSSLSLEVREKLINTFKEENTNLSALINREILSWIN